MHNTYTPAFICKWQGCLMVFPLRFALSNTSLTPNSSDDMKYLNLLLLLIITLPGLAQHDWDNYEVPANAGVGKTWQLQEVSDDFNYDSPADTKSAEFSERWTDFFHNGWSGPKPTVWQRDHVYVEDGKLKLKASRVEGENVTFDYNGTSTTLPATRLGCITSKQRIQYPVYIECNVKITNSVLASDVWLLSADDTQEIDICEAYGSARYSNDWFSNKRLHLSHHVFIRSPFQDWQPNDEGSFYTDSRTVWSDDYHRIGVYWIDPWNLEYYVDGEKVRTRSGKAQIDPNDFTDGTGLSKPMDIIINTEDQTWRAAQGLSPTARELTLTDDHTFKVDWVRIYKPVDESTSTPSIEAAETQISPNPITDSFQITSNKKVKHLTICALNGSIKQSKTINNTSQVMDASQLYSGVYIFRLHYADNSQSLHKIIKL